MKRTLPFFIFTSGESGYNGLDWGVKFASTEWGSIQKLDSLYRQTLDVFALRPALERPTEGNIAVLTMPMGKDFLLGLILPYHDSPQQGSRENIIFIGLKITRERLKTLKLGPGQIAGALLKEEKTFFVGKRPEERGENLQTRPNFLDFSQETAKKLPKDYLDLYFWPESGEAFLFIDGRTRTLTAKDRTDPDFASAENRTGKTKTGRLTIKRAGALMVAAALLLSLGVLFFSGKKTGEKSLERSQGEELPAVSKIPAEVQKLGRTTETGVPASKIIEDALNEMPQDVIDNITHVAWLSAEQYAAFISESRIPSLTIKAVYKGEGNLRENFQIVKDSPGVLIMDKAGLACFLNKTIKAYYLDLDTATGGFYPLEIKTDFSFGEPETLSREISPYIQSCALERNEERAGTSREKISHTLEEMAQGQEGATVLASASAKNFQDSPGGYPLFMTKPFRTENIYLAHASRTAKFLLPASSAWPIVVDRDAMAAALSNLFYSSGSTFVLQEQPMKTLKRTNKEIHPEGLLRGKSLDSLVDFLTEQLRSQMINSQHRG